MVHVARDISTTARGNDILHAELVDPFFHTPRRFCSPASRNEDTMQRHAVLPRGLHCSRHARTRRSGQSVCPTGTSMSSRRWCLQAWSSLQSTNGAMFYRHALVSCSCFVIMSRIVALSFCNLAVDMWHIHSHTCSRTCLQMYSCLSLTRSRLQRRFFSM